jgi:HlyD family secretion protein
MISFFSALSGKTIFFGAIVMLAIGIGVYVLWPEEAAIETITVAPGEFVQEVSASGKVVPARDVELGFTQSGRIVSVSVDVGDRVSAGATLARLDSGELAAALSQRRAALDTQKARLEAILQGTRPEEIAVAESQVDSSLIALSQTRAALLDEVRDAYTVADSAVRNNVFPFVTNPRSNNPQLNFTVTDSQAAVDFLASIVRVENMLVEWQGDLINATESTLSDLTTETQTNLADVATFLSDASAILNRAQTNQSVSATMIAGYSADVSAARTTMSTEISALTSATTAERNAAAALASAERNLSLKEAGAVAADIAAQEAQIKAAEADVESVLSQISKTVITAPFSGTVTAVEARTGAIASPNQPLITMIGSGAFQIDSYIPEINIAAVKPGDIARVTLDAYGESEVFQASVVSIDPAETVRDGVATYRAILQFTTADDRIRSGMTANIVITTERREGVISVPQGLVVERDGARYVKVLEGETVVERQVTTGSISSLGLVEILTGLSAGDRVLRTTGI